MIRLTVSKVTGSVGSTKTESLTVTVERDRPRSHRLEKMLVMVMPLIGALVSGFASRRM